MFKTLATGAILALTALPAYSERTQVWFVTSGNVTGAGTDSNVYATFNGPKGMTARMRMQDEMSGNLFEPGDIDTFTFDTDIGPGVTTITLESMGDYSGSDWHLDKIVTYTYDPSNPLGAGAIGFITVWLSTGMVLPDLVNEGGVLSTFNYRDWITGDEQYSSPSESRTRSGIRLTRAEPAAKETGTGKTIETLVSVVYLADALDSNQPDAQSFSKTITRSDSLTTTSGTSDTAAVGLELNYGYAPPDAVGGSSYGVNLSAEYEYVRENTSEQVFGTATESKREEAFEAAPGTMELRIVTATGNVTVRDYESLFGNGSFVATYLRDAGNIHSRAVTMAAGVPSDTQWNRSAARHVASSLGCSGYDRIVSRLKLFGTLVNPLSCEHALEAPL